MIKMQGAVLCNIIAPTSASDAPTICRVALFTCIHPSLLFPSRNCNYADAYREVFSSSIPSFSRFLFSSSFSGRNVLQQPELHRVQRCGDLEIEKCKHRRNVEFTLPVGLPEASQMTPKPCWMPDPHEIHFPNDYSARLNFRSRDGAGSTLTFTATLHIRAARNPILISCLFWREFVSSTVPGSGMWKGRKLVIHIA